MPTETEKQYIAKIEEYQRDIQHKPKAAISNDHCNEHFTISDSLLSNLCNSLHNAIKSGLKVSGYGLQIPFHTENSSLRNRCCNCANNNNPYTTRNAVRTSTQQILYLWAKRAKEDYVAPETKASNYTKAARKVGSKRRGV
jgi:hypothetical protein